MDTLPGGAWVAIGLIVLLIFSLYLGLWAAWKRKNKFQGSDWLKKMSQIVRNPWLKEDQMMQDLSNKIKSLKDRDDEKDIHSKIGTS